VSELAVLQAMRLKGRLTADAAAVCVAGPVDRVQVRLGELVAAGLATLAGTAFRITSDGRERLAALLDSERRSVDQAVLRAAYHDFDMLNTEVKTVVTAWQLRADQTPNDHSEAAYDAAVIERLAALHDRFAPLLARMVAIAPRLAPYGARFGNAVQRIRAGDPTFVARPITDSYHTVWFELHEELIGLLGRTRAEEAAAGRAV